MRINRFAFKDLSTGWQLDEASFGSFDLLVGVSGVGKTKVVKALTRVQRFVTDDKFDPGAMKWTLDFEHDGVEYHWEGETEQSGELARSEAFVVRERLIQGSDIIAERGPDGALFQGNPLPRLTRADSLVTLLAEEKALAGVQGGLARFLDTDIYPDLRLSVPARSRAQLEEVRTQWEHISARTNQSLPVQIASLAKSGRPPLLINSAMLLLWAYCDCSGDTPEFRDIKARFTDIFPTVEDIQLSWTESGSASGDDVLELSIRERGVSHWIPAREISSGMRRTIALLLTAHYAPPGTVVIIDELENSLGVNCMSEVLDLLQSRTDCQFIATSHHPYIINNLPVATWKLVRRHGSRVRIDPVTSLPSFDPGSRHQAFLKLINLPEFEDGIT
ncbi:AAA family ATPase [Haliangium sp.]|uniref:AAA family ATPase n=1 Tax=Haliangium sp. TaxID=2663208 RepID=UPI003D0E4B92